MIPDYIDKLEFCDHPIIKEIRVQSDSQSKFSVPCRSSRSKVEPMRLANSYKIIRGDLLDLQSGKVREGTSRQ